MNGYECLKKTVGNIKNYIDVTNLQNVETYIFSNEEILEKIAAIVFIPTKFRIYGEMSYPDNNFPLTKLREGYKSTCIPVIDLTKPLKNEALKLKKVNEFVFWKDDTHWNGRGISVTANVINTFISKYEHGTECNSYKQ